MFYVYCMNVIIMPWNFCCDGAMSSMPGKDTDRVTKTQIYLVIQCQAEGQLWKGFKLSKLSIERWLGRIKKEKRWWGGRGEEQNKSLLTHGCIEDGKLRPTRKKEMQRPWSGRPAERFRLNPRSKRLWDLKQETNNHILLLTFITSYDQSLYLYCHIYPYWL